MKLYHGTSARKLKLIQEHGLRPRGKHRKSNWNKNPSHPLAIYLTNAYACFYANAACVTHTKWAIFEVDTTKLDKHSFAPDEDFLEQCGRGRDGIPGTIHERTATLKSRLFGYSGDLTHKPITLSLQHLGNCVYFGNIPPGAITRVALVDIKKAAKEFVYNVFDPSITLINYRILGAAYRNSLRWLFDGDNATLEPNEYKVGFQPIADRTGIAITTLKR